MKFKKGGKVFDSIYEAALNYRDCSSLLNGFPCTNCKLSIEHNGKMLTCSDFKKQYPREAAEIMGYEVIEDEAEKAKKSLCDWTLAEVKEQCQKQGDNCLGCALYLDDDCFISGGAPSIWNFCLKLTPKELEICKLINAEHITWPNGHEYVCIYVYTDETHMKRIAEVDHSIFPSVKQGDSIDVRKLNDDG